MVLTTCWRCLRIPLRLLVFARTPPPLARAVPPLLARTLVPPTTTIAAAAPFSTTSQRSAEPAKKKSPGGPAPKKGTRTLRINKTVRTRQKLPQGERRKLRTTIVLSNTNAPALDLLQLTRDTLDHDNIHANILAIPSDVIDRLRTLEAFKRGQSWSWFHSPSTIIRRESLWLGRRLKEAEGEGGVDGVSAAMMKMVEESVKGADGSAGEAQGEAGESTAEAQLLSQALQALENKGKHVRIILDGARGVGKSVLLLQTMAWAMQRGWVIINIPNAQDLVIGHTEYEFDANHKLWVQRVYAQKLLRQIAQVNHAVFSGLPLSRSYTFGRTHSVAEFEGLPGLIRVGTSDASTSHDVLLALLQELSTGPLRPPVLFALDNLAQLMLPETAYRDTRFKPIHPHDLALPHLFLQYLSGNLNFSRGMTLAATSSAAPRAEALAYALRKEPQPPYSKLDPRIPGAIRGAHVFKVDPMSAEEVNALVEYCARSGLVPRGADSMGLAERMVLTGAIPKNVLESCVRVRM